MIAPAQSAADLVACVFGSLRIDAPATFHRVLAAAAALDATTSNGAAELLRGLRCGRLQIEAVAAAAEAAAVSASIRTRRSKAARQARRRQRCAAGRSEGTTTARTRSGHRTTSGEGRATTERGTNHDD